MASNKKKRGSSLIILLLVMIILIVACLWLTKYKKDQANTDSKENSTEDTTIASVDSKNIKSIYFKNADTEMTLVKDSDGVWKSSEDEALPVNQTNAASMMNALSTITSSNTIKESAEELSTYGLDKPVVQIVATVKDGTTTSISIGNESPLGGGYYATLNGGAEIYVLSSDFYNCFAYKQSDMVTVETIPTITAENVTYLQVENKDKPNFEVSFDESKSSDYSGLNNWFVKQPYAKEVAGSADDLKTLFGNYASLSFLSCVNYNATDLSKYGLEDPASTVTLKYYEVYTKNADSTDTADSSDASNSTSEAETTKVYKDLVLQIGSTDADGNYYAKLKDSKAVNTISADTVAKITDIDAYSNVSHMIALVNISNVDKVDATVNGKTYTMRLEQSANTSESSESTDKKVTGKYYFNDKEVEESKFKDLYQQMIGITSEKNIPDEYFASSKDRTPYLTMAFHLTTGKTITMQYLPYDESYYVADIDGSEIFLTDLRGINKLADTLANFQSK